MNSYHRKYGSTRAIRAERMANNIPPVNMDVPPVGNIRWGGVINTVAVFDDTHRYVESLFTNGRLKANLRGRTFIVVRSQKYSAENRIHYFVHLSYGVRLENVDFRNIGRYLSDCGCQDRRLLCKHKLAINFSAQGHMRVLRSSRLLF